MRRGVGGQGACHRGGQARLGCEGVGGQGAGCAGKVRVLRGGLACHRGGPARLGVEGKSRQGAGLKGGQTMLGCEGV